MLIDNLIYQYYLGISISTLVYYVLKINIEYKNEKAYFEQGLFTGKCIIFTADNKKRKLLSFKKGIQHGLNEGYYYPDEQIEYVGFMRKGEINGKYTRYHLNGSININGKMRRGYRVGNWKFLNEEGVLLKKITFLRGRAIDSIIFN